MNKAIAIATAILAIAIYLFLAPLVGIALGAFTGWIVGMVFPGTMGIIATLITSGVTIPAWQVGAILGFVGGFFKTHLTTTRSS